ncbi:MAG: hypothetical protein IRZ28_13305 [Steroidobacteraceae bacterium]|nr:hypothetical protein [Steroidobacteraceae bacterium]
MYEKTTIKRPCAWFLRCLASVFLLGVTLTACVSQPFRSPNAQEVDWQKQFLSAAQEGKTAEAIEALMELAERHPDALAALGRQLDTARTVVLTVLSAEPAAKYRAMTALFDRHWLLPNRFQPADLWMELLPMEIEKGNIRRAAEVAARIQEPPDILLIRVDKRFDPLVRAYPRQFDLTAATDRFLAFLSDLCRKFPRTLAHRISLVYTLLDAGRFEEAIATADEVLALSPDLQTAILNYDDADAWFNWLLDYRASALEALGIWHDAEKYRKRAAELPEEGRPNVSNAINLAGLYSRLGRSREALAALGDMASPGEGLSRYGRMQVDLILLQTALTEGDESRAKEVLERMRQSQAASLRTFEEALLVANQMDEAAMLLIRRLGDPKTRTSALLDVQAYLPGGVSPYDRMLDERWAQLRTRQDVIAAVEKVGRIESVPRPRR